MLDDLRRLRNVRAVIQNIVKNYGKYFHGHTSIENILDTPACVFNIRHLAVYETRNFPGPAIQRPFPLLGQCPPGGDAHEKLV